jgi:type VII secretion-associated serine protease mycosin
MSPRSAVAAAVLVAVGLPLVGVVPAHAAPPEGACRDPQPAGPAVPDLPWAQKSLALKRTWQHSTGAGVTVAVVDSGVDADHPQLQGEVFPGRDFFLVGEHPGNFDCQSHGTAVASIIAAAPTNGVGFSGIAPGARILPVRVVDKEVNDEGEPIAIDPDTVASGIRYAADQGAKVINLSLSGYGDFPAIRDAVAYAQSLDALLVAAVGNRQGKNKDPGPSFPAAYEGVLGVGSIDMAGQRSSGSQIGDYVDLVAPGEGVLGATRVAGHNYWTGTSFAAPFVSGAAALVRSAWPNLTAPEVAARILATASPARGGKASLEYGVGVVDPYRAVTEQLSITDPSLMPLVTDPPVDVDGMRNLAWWQQMGAGAKLVAGMVVLAIAVTAILAFALPRGRRRRWLARRRAPVPTAPVRQEPPDQIFLFPPPPVEQIR